MATSEISGFYKKSLSERLQLLKEACGLSEAEISELRKYAAMDFETADRMVENAVGTQQLPLGIATNFLINGKDYLVPMAIEEPSVVAAASKAAGIARASGGFRTQSSPAIMIGQVQIVKAKSPEKAVAGIKRNERKILELANSADPVLVQFGGGAKKIEARAVKTERGKIIIAHLLVDVKDAMGANAVNTMCEKIAPLIEEISGGEARLRIISNLAIYRTAKAKAVFSKKALEESFKKPFLPLGKKALPKNCGDKSNFICHNEGDMKGEEVIEHILDACNFAANDIFRACTHNKGIMNGIDAVAMATGQDWRAIEAGAHAFASMKGKYLPLTRYYKDKQGNLIGEIELPMAVGLIGGAVKTSPMAKIAVKMLGVKRANELAEIMAAVGLAQNFAALRALATEGIQKGHMRLHAKNIAVMAGAKGKEIEAVAEKMSKEKNIRQDRAKELIEEIKKKQGWQKS